jgi:hypothetical protein
MTDEAVQDVNVYAVKFFGTKKRAVDARAQPTLVTIKNHAEDDESLELVCSYLFLLRAATEKTNQPSPVFLKLHAALCGVLDACGRAEELTRVLEDLGDGSARMLARDGSGMEELHTAMMRSIAAGRAVCPLHS